ncbi:MAG: spoIIIJ-associated protein [Microgenomates group bacterium Gr01-1014_93]|nr:MAG: spoIIIJ-associated protein [Microgenomates group bacterium Gr01-1014_93]
MEEDLSEILDNILGLLLLEGSYDINEDENGLNVTIETKDAGRLIGFKGESLSSLQLLVNQMMGKKGEPGSGETEGFKRVILDVEGWRKNKETELLERAKQWALEVKQSGQEMELEPMPSWQRRIVHMGVSEVEGVESESVGEGRDRHLVIKPS